MPVIDNTPDYDKFIADSLSTEEKAAFSRDRDLVARRKSAVELVQKEIETENPANALSQHRRYRIRRKYSQQFA